MPAYSDRRNFIKQLVAAGILTQFPLFIACEQKKAEILPEIKNISTLKSVLNIIFPSELGPGVEDINVLGHLENILSDTNLDAGENRYIVDGLQWVEETAAEVYQKSYHQISQSQKEKLIQKIRQETWGENWLSRLLTIVFEALLLDSIYHVNSKGIGWKWLQHQPGNPRPDADNVYPDILKRKKENIVITKLSQL